MIPFLFEFTHTYPKFIIHTLDLQYIQEKKLECLCLECMGVYEFNVGHTYRGEKKMCLPVFLILCAERRASIRMYRYTFYVSLT